MAAILFLDHWKTELQNIRYSNVFGIQDPTVIESTLMCYRMEMDRRVCMAYLISVCIRLFLERRERELSQFVTLFKAANAADEKISLMERFLAELW